ncbi:DNA cytosine methyltransferase [Mammaliicoccus sciuri]|uniref:DNA cytosine methyltransferase n=1 Tax=Mammaliicoccus sciuri TaxID=1296 RepID=UPI00265B80A9|nr:DNA cytosine methyltransferase [Mammaliicoccus sciuri]MDO0952919.1 DNA cytosine methyltransferase [Mammaliicoccus sciuri]
MNVIDLFSGVGGFSEGFKKEGYDIVLANEIDAMIAESYKGNHKSTLMINADIKEFAVNTDKLINEEIKKIDSKSRQEEIKNKLSKIDVIIGGPPCQGFSMAGSRIRKHKEFIEDPRNFLFKYYFKVLQKFEPEYFVFENVQGLLNMNKGKILEEILSIFSDDNSFENGGYNLDWMLVDSSNFGVPQKRKRLIIVGSKSKKINLKKELQLIIDKFEIPSNVSVRDAISDLSYLESGEGQFQSMYLNKAESEYQINRRRNSQKLYNHIAPRHDEKTLNRISEISEGSKYISKDESQIIKSVHSGAYGRMSWDKESYTITTRFDTPSAGRVIHPELNRALTPREAARLQSFDDNFIFTGNKTSIGKQIGNAVPPLLSNAIAKILK